MIKPEDRILIAVSGGPDSICLMYILKELASIHKISIAVAHLNHCLRGDEANKDAEFVLQQARNLKLPIYTDKVDVRQIAEQQKLSIEEAGRKARYNFLEEIAEKENFNTIATGHNRDDLSETILMRLLRGCGTIGLLGIPPLRKCGQQRIIRPLIETGRREIVDYLDSNQIQYRIDTSNMDSKFLRNRIRNELLPLLEKEFNPKTREVLISLSKILDTESAFLEQSILPIYAKVVEVKNKHMVLNIPGFRNLHQALQRSVLRRIILDVKGNLLGITYRHIEDLSDLVYFKPSGRKINLPEGITAIKEYENLLFVKGKYIKPTVTEGTVKIPGATIFEMPRMEVTTEILTSETIEISKLAKHAGKLSRTWNEPGMNGISEFEEFFDADRIGKKLIFRSRHEGDRFTPIGLTGSKKVKDIMIDEKISPRFRETIPLLATEDDIVWIVGYRISEHFKILETTKRILRIKVRFFR